MGLEVVTAGDGQQGLEYCSRAAFDLILSDLMLPAFNRHQLQKSIGSD
jgi:CheY-like chemotaxis protein